MPFGAALLADGTAVFRLWAPRAQRVDLRLGEQLLPMRARADGFFELRVPQAKAGLRYAYRIDGDLQVPDPASRCNPDGVHAASRLVDAQAFDWLDAQWRGRPWHEAVIYELHIGCFTREGSFAAASARLDDLVKLGVTAIELMPVAAFSGRHGWGYDSVLPFAPHAAYGTPDDLKRLVAAAHERGLMVLLDVVYNHFGPDGNYLHAYASDFFNPAVRTPWGAAINFDAARSDTVRAFFVHNALYWLEEFHFDGLRIDAVHALHDDSTTAFIDQLATAVRAGPGRLRQVHLVLENDLNDAARLKRGADGAPLLADAQWNDDVHHAAHVIVTGERDGYYADFASQSLRLLGRALAEGFAYQGQPSAFRDGAGRGTPSAHLPPLAFVNALQTHDQVGNRAFGERIQMLATGAGRDDALRALLACVLLSPSPPLLFMGEEYAASTPFLYFCDFAGELAQAVANGRRGEFARFARFADVGARERIPDPNAASTFARSRLDWSERRREPHAAWLALYRHLLRVRRETLMPWLAGAASGQFEVLESGTLLVSWPLANGQRWHLRAQLSDRHGDRNSAPMLGQVAYRSHTQGGVLPPWSVCFSLHGA